MFKIAVTLITLTLSLSGCSGVLDPHGPVGTAEKLILTDSVAIMLVIVIPVILATLGFAWWFRSSNTRANYLPAWNFSGHLELIVWAIPTLVITFLGGIAWYGSHALDPYKLLASKVEPLEIEVVSLDWKWLFIYPEEGIATINQLIVPVGRPLHFRLTSTGVMNSFFVPQLGSQIYTMAGMTSQVSLQADSEGVYRGISAQFSGEGFADMHFNVTAMPESDFKQWIRNAKTARRSLDSSTYALLVEPSKNVSPTTFGAVQPRLFEDIATQISPPNLPRDKSAKLQKVL